MKTNIYCDKTIIKDALLNDIYSMIAVANSMKSSVVKHQVDINFDIEKNNVVSFIGDNTRNLTITSLTPEEFKKYMIKGDIVEYEFSIINLKKFKKLIDNYTLNYFDSADNLKTRYCLKMFDTNELYLICINV